MQQRQNRQTAFTGKKNINRIRVKWGITLIQSLMQEHAFTYYLAVSVTLRLGSAVAQW